MKDRQAAAGSADDNTRFVPGPLGGQDRVAQLGGGAAFDIRHVHLCPLGKHPQVVGGLVLGVADNPDFPRPNLFDHRFHDLPDSDQPEIFQVGGARMAAIHRRSPASGKDARIMTSPSRTVNGLRGERVVLADPISSRTWFVIDQRQQGRCIQNEALRLRHRSSACASCRRVAIRVSTRDSPSGTRWRTSARTVCNAA